MEVSDSPNTELQRMVTAKLATPGRSTGPGTPSAERKQPPNGRLVRLKNTAEGSAGRLDGGREGPANSETGQ